MTRNMQNYVEVAPGDYRKLTPYHFEDLFDDSEFTDEDVDPIVDEIHTILTH